jgi:peptidoglycan/LPS O-acetylase OafA/YrhL
VGNFPLLEGIDTSSKIGWLVKGLYDATINGPAAVIVFFVISGFAFTISIAMAHDRGFFSITHAAI